METLLTESNMFLAQEMPQVPWSTTSGWLWGAIGFTGVVFLVLGVVNQCRKLWGRKPPLDEEFENLGRTWRNGSGRCGSTSRRGTSGWSNRSTSCARRWI